MSYLSKAASHPRAAGGFATVLVVGTFLGALALAGSGEEAASFDSSILDSNGLMIAMSLETDSQQVALAAPRISSPKIVSPACSWENDGVAEICQSDWPYSDVRVAKPEATVCYDDFGDTMDCQSDAPQPERHVARSAENLNTGSTTCGDEIDNDSPPECLEID